MCIRDRHAIDHFQGMTASRSEIGHQTSTLTASKVVLPRMRQADPGYGRTQGGDGFFQHRPVLLDVTQLSRAQPLAKRLGAIAHMAGAHEKFGEMWPVRRIAAIAQFLLNGPRALQSAWHTFGGEASVDLLRTLPAPMVQGIDGSTQRRRLAL